MIDRMHGRASQHDVTNSIDVEQPATVCEEVRRILSARYPGYSFDRLPRIFSDVADLFQGRWAGYRACDTPYHDLRHTLDVTLAMARLIDGHDGTHAGAEQLGPERALLGIVTALFHDSGYIVEERDTAHRFGAEYTLIHVSRSADLLSRYLPRIGLAAHIEVASEIVHYTGYERPFDTIKLRDRRDQLLGFILGTADLIAQMSDRAYLEKCRDFLFEEFVHAGIAHEALPDGRIRINYDSPTDLLFKTREFFQQVALPRLDQSFEGVYRFAGAHFAGSNHYIDEIALNFAYLTEVIDTKDVGRLRRRCTTLSVRPAQAQ
jgi:hypothetical protein